MRFIDLAAQQRRIRQNIENRLKAVLDHGQYIMGPEVAELEKRLAAHLGVKHAVGCGSGTDALLLALMAHGVGPGDAIFTSPFTFIATAEVVCLLGAVPVFVDIETETFALDPEKLAQALEALRLGDAGRHPLPRPAQAAGSLRPRGIIGVDLFGLPADYDRINALAKAQGLFVIEDAAQSFGAEIHGRRAGTLAQIACTSFYPAKPLGAYGEAGMCFTDDDRLAELMRSVGNHGAGTHRYDNVRVGLNGRLDSFQAAVLLAKFDIFEEELALRQAAARRYDHLLNGGGGLNRRFRPPVVPGGCFSSWAQYSVLIQDGRDRDQVQAELRAAGVPTAVHYPCPLHLQPAFAHLGYREGDFPRSEDVARRIMSLPMHPYLSPEEQEKVVAAMLK